MSFCRGALLAAPLHRALGWGGLGYWGMGYELRVCCTSKAVGQCFGARASWPQCAARAGGSALQRVPLAPAGLETCPHTPDPLSAGLSTPHMPDRGVFDCPCRAQDVGGVQRVPSPRPPHPHALRDRPTAAHPQGAHTGPPARPGPSCTFLDCEGAPDMELQSFCGGHGSHCPRLESRPRACRGTDT